jgi:proteic killer suppression protein
MIKSFCCKKTEQFFLTQKSKCFSPQILEKAMDRLIALNYASKLGDIQSSPAIHLEPLQGDRKGQWSIRINKQWRICFKWDGNDVHSVEIVDYH